MTAPGAPSSTSRLRAGRAVTSCAQDGLWFLDRIAPRSTAHRICRVYQISGTVDVEALRSSWQAVVARHDTLRTTIGEVDGRPVQKIAADVPGSFRFIDLTGVAPSTHDSHADRFGSGLGADAVTLADRLCAGLATVPLSLADGPLARLTVIRLAPAVHRVVLVLHRVIADDRSVSILVDELAAHYASGTARRDLPVQYADYARWQRDRESGMAARRLRIWWTSALTPPPPSLVLPVDRNRPGRPAADGTLRFDWGQDLAGHLADLCRTEGTTPLPILLAAFQALLFRYGDEDRVAVGVPVAVRPPRFAELIGQFDNLLVLAGDLRGAPTFRELTGRTARAVRDAADRRELPFSHLVRTIGVDRDPRRIPLCDAMFVFRDEPESELALAGVDVRRHPIDTVPAATDLILTVDRVEPSVVGSLAYRGEVFDRAPAAAVLDQLRTLLAAGLSTPDTPVGELPMDSAERARATARAADQLAAPGAVEPAHETVRGHATRAPEAAAIAWAGGTLSYVDLEREVVRIAGHLHALGVEGSAVAIRMAPGQLQAAASLAVLRAGAHLIWFGTGDAGERGRSVLDEQRPAALLYEGDPAADTLAGWFRDELGGTVLDPSDLNDGAVAAQRPTVSLDQVAYVAYTSGSTGKPKGIAQSHGAFAQFVTWMAEELGMGPGARVAHWVAPEHDPSLCEAFATLVGGGTLCPVPDKIRVHPEKLVDWLAGERITFLQTVPSFARELLNVIKADGVAERLGSLERLVLMGEALPVELVNGLRAALPGVRLINIYGPTETIAATWCELTDGLGETAATVPIGQSIPGRQVLVLDDADRQCPVGATGEIVIRSPYVARGYIGDETGGGAFRPIRELEDAEPVRCYRTGDLARRRWDGLLEFRGRRDHQVKLYGNRLELAEVEAALAEHDSVAECAVVPLTDADGLVIQLVAYVVPRRTSDTDAKSGASAWRAQLRRRFGPSMMLVQFETLTSALPRSIAGKVDRRRLPTPRALLAEATRVPQTWVERGVAEIWSQLLGAQRIGAGEAFFAAGGHSLLIPQLVDRIRERFGVEIPIWECFTHNTVAGMSALIVSAGAREEAAA